MRKTTITLRAAIVEDEGGLSLAQFCAACALHADLVLEMVEEGILDPGMGSISTWRFSGQSIRRVRSALRLRDDLGVNLAGAAVILNLRDEVVRLRRLLAREGRAGQRTVY